MNGKAKFYRQGHPPLPFFCKRSSLWAKEKQQRKNDIKKFLYTHGIKKYCK